MKNKKSIIWIICGVMAVALIALVITMLLTNNDKEKDKPKKEDPKQEEKKKPTNEVEVSEGDEISEEEIVAIYGVSKKDAEEIVRKIFTEDGYEFSTKITRNGYYRVTVNDTVTKDTLIFRIDPATKIAIQE